MEFSISRRNNKLYVKVNGEIDHHSCAPLRDCVDLEIKSGGVRELIFDFSKLTLMDSSGIGILMGRYKLMKLCGGSVTVVGAESCIEKIMKLSGISDIIKIKKAG